MEIIETIFDVKTNTETQVKKEYEQPQEELDNVRIDQIKARLNELSQDIIQADLGAVFSDLDQRKTEFKALHNELRVLLNKEPRIYI